MTSTHTLLLPLALAAAVASYSTTTEAAKAPVPSEAIAIRGDKQPAATPLVADSGTYTLDPGHTNILVQWNHLGFSHPSANFSGATGTLRYDSEYVSRSRLEVTIPMSGLDALYAPLTEHLLSADFFDAAKYPQATFKSTQVVPVGVNQLSVTGKLTIKGITRPATLKVVMNASGVSPTSRLPTIGFDATTVLRRSDFGVGLYAPNTSDEVSLRITSEVQNKGK